MEYKTNDKVAEILQRASMMGELNPVSGTHVLLESMLQRLRLNTNSGSQTDTQTSSLSLEFNTETGEHSSEPAVYQFGCSSDNSKEQNRRSIWNNNESPWTQQSSHFGGSSTPVTNLPVRRIRKHESSAKPKRVPLIWQEHNQFTPDRSSDVISCAGVDGTSRLEKNPQFVAKSSVPPIFKTEPYQTTPDLVAQTFTTSPSVLETPEVRGQIGTWRRSVEKDPVKNTKTSKKLGEAKRWAQKVKERWREKHRGTETKPRGDGGKQAQNKEVQNSLSSFSWSVDVTDTTTRLSENLHVHNEPINTDESVSRSLSCMSENLLSSSTCNLMEEIFSGTQWAQFLSVNSTTLNQSNESPSGINQSHQEESWTGKWEPMTLPESFTQDTASNEPYNQNYTSKNVTELHNQSQTSDLCANQLQTTDMRLTESHNREQIHKQAQFSHQHSRADERNTSQLTPSQQSPQSQVSDLSHNRPQEGKENFIPLLDLSDLKAADSSSTNTQGSLRRKREHWTKRRDLFEDAGQQMEINSSSYMATRSPDSCSISSTSSLSSLQNSEDSESSVSMETAVKKRRMDDTRRVRFSEKLIILPPIIWPEDEEGREGEETADWPEKPPPRPSFPKWIASLKGKRTKYKF